MSEEINWEWALLGLSRSDGKILYPYLRNYANGENCEVKFLADYFHIDLEPLKKIAHSLIEPLDYYLETLPSLHEPDPKIREWFREVNTAEWYQIKKGNEEAWQSPDDLILALEPFTKAIEKQPEVLILALQEQQQVSDFDYTYFSNGSFLRDLQDLLNVSYHAKEQGVEKIRLSIG